MAILHQASVFKNEELWKNIELQTLSRNCLGILHELYYN